MFGELPYSPRTVGVAGYDSHVLPNPIFRRARGWSFHHALWWIRNRVHDDFSIFNVVDVDAAGNRAGSLTGPSIVLAGRSPRRNRIFGAVRSSGRGHIRFCWAGEVTTEVDCLPGLLIDLCGELSWINLIVPKPLFLLPLTRFPGFV